jgi:DNA segregation ATPase FtsK/SpoIIIE-like protein
MDGSVSFRPGNLDEWAGATLNYPLTNGDRLWTDEESRAELHIGATAIHMAELTAFGILNLDSRAAQMSLAEGTVYLRIPRMDDDQAYEMDTPSGAIILRRTGDYRFDVSEDGSATLVTVRSGEAEVVAGGQNFTVHPGQTLRLVGTDPVSGDVVQAAALDPWEEWCVGRDALAEHTLELSESYVAPEMTGSEDLGQYGDWSTDPTYGAVWCPRGVGSDWAPYRFGHWAYVGLWGWTWIDDAQWGFAPFHYGRWLHTANGWEWIPGPRGARPVYAPALVAFVGGRASSRAQAVSGGRSVSWIPLGPGEAFRPPYHASDAYLRRVNGGRDPGAPGRTFANTADVTAVSQTIFVGARQVSSGAVRMPASAPGSVTPDSVSDLRPGRESYLGRPAQPGVRAVRPPATVVSRRVVGKDAAAATAQTASPSVAVPPIRDQASRPGGPGLPNDSGRPLTGGRPPVTGRTDPSSPQPASSVPPVQDERQRQAEQQRAEQQRAQQQQAERQRADQQRAGQQRTDQQRADQQRAEQQRTDQQRADQQRAEQQRTDQQRADQQRAEQQRTDQQRAEQQRAEQQRAEQQRAEQQRAEQQRAEQQRAEQQRAEQQRAEQRRAEQQRAEQQRAEQQRAEQQRAEQQRAEQQRAEQQRAEQQRAEQQRAEQQRAEQQRAEQQRAEQQRAEQQRVEQQRQAEEKRAADEKKAAEDRKKQ